MEARKCQGWKGEHSPECDGSAAINTSPGKPCIYSLACRQFAHKRQLQEKGIEQSAYLKKMRGPGGFRAGMAAKKVLAVKLAGLGCTLDQISRRSGLSKAAIYNLHEGGHIHLSMPIVESRTPPDGHITLSDFAASVGADRGTVRRYFRRRLIRGVVVGKNLFIAEGQSIEHAREKMSTKVKNWMEFTRREAAKAKCFEAPKEKALE